MRFIGVIPARYTSVRLPGKPLLAIAGKPLIQWVYERARQARRLDDVVVATDDRRVYDAVAAFGGKAVMTANFHISGTDRVSEVARNVAADVFVNIQGDEPLIPPSTIDAVCEPFQKDPQVQITTARVEITDLAQIESPHVVKVVVNSQDEALYFSRAVIPHPRRPPLTFCKHVGIYAYRREVLLNLDRLRPSRLEKIEGLEQLRFLENCIPIRVVLVREDSLGVDTPEDVERVRLLLENVSQ